MQAARRQIERVQRFVDILGDYGVTATVRVRRGIDIDAGCGQLKAAVIKSKASRNRV